MTALTYILWWVIVGLVSTFLFALGANGRPYFPELKAWIFCTLLWPVFIIMNILQYAESWWKSQ
jgi:hypothetical protein